MSEATGIKRRLRTLERRINPRRRVVYRMDVTGKDGELLACLIDISLGGMRVRWFAPVDVADVTKLRIEFPQWLGMGEGLPVKGRFVWCKPLEGGKVEAGFAFVEAGKKQLAMLESLMDKIATAAEEDRIG